MSVHSDDSFIHDCTFSKFDIQNGMPTHNTLITHYVRHLNSYRHAAFLSPKIISRTEFISYGQIGAPANGN